MRQPLQLNSYQLLVAALVFSVLALLGNIASLPLFFGVDIIFGSIFVFTALLLCGFQVGLLTVLISAAYTIVLWNHSYALIIFVIEFVSVFLLLRTRKLNLVQADTLFWLLGGIPLVYFFYTQMIGLPFQATILIMLKQGLNGIFNALVAYNLALVIQHFFRLQEQEPYKSSLSEIFYGVLLLAVLVSNFLISGLIGRKEFSRLEPEINTHLLLVHALVGQKITLTLRNQARPGSDSKTAKKVQALLRDATLSSKAKFFVLDHRGAVVASTFSKLPLGQQYRPKRFAVFKTLDGGVTQITPRAAKQVAAMKKWAQSRYQTPIQLVRGTRLKLGTTIPAKPYQAGLYATYIQLLLITLGIGVFFILAGSVMASGFLGSMHQLVRASGRIPEKLQANKVIAWPESSIREIHTLCTSFQGLTATLKDMFGQMTDLNAALEEQVEERTAQLRQALQEAESANISKSQFLMTMSHELRTPMNAIIGFTNVLIKKSGAHLSDKELLYLNKVKNNGMHLLDLINEILDISKLEAGAVEPRPEEVDIFEVIDNVVNQLLGLAQSKQLELKTSCLVASFQVTTDPKLLRQILVNLVGNAIKFTEQGSITVRVTTSPSPPCVPVIEVVDTGIGIEEEDLSNLFEPFTQVDSSSTRKQEGTGLGLAISSSLSELLGYELSVQSKLNTGTTFSLLLTEAQKEA